MRRAEVCSLLVDDLRLDEGALLVRRKGRREKVQVPLPPGIVTALRRWLVHRGPEDGPLFHRLDRAGTGKLTGEAVRRMLARRCRQAGLPEIRPHGLRHSGATRVARATGDLVTVQSWGGWSGPGSASRYLDDKVERSREAAEMLDVRSATAC